jgi:hypothetical protein
VEQRAKAVVEDDAMGFLDKLLGREEPRPDGQAYGPPATRPMGQATGNAMNPRGGAPMNADEQAVARYRYMLQTAPPEQLEQAHAEAFARLSSEQRQLALQQLANHIPENERAGLRDDPQSLARAATRAEIRQPGALQSAFGGMGGGGMGGGMGMMGGMGAMMAGGLITSLAGAFIGTSIANSFFSNPMNEQGFSQAAQEAGIEPASMQDLNAGETTADPYGDPADPYGDPADQSGLQDASDPYGDPADAGGDFGGGDFGGGDFGGFEA